jgi:hypothetical protein
MTDLSPAAAKAFNAAWAETGIILGDHAGTLRAQLAAAFRAVADEVLPSPRLPFDSCCEIRSAGERVELLAIADELEALDD